MAVFCDSECEMVGALCDFCTHYKDDCTDGKFQGEGLCTVKGVRVEAHFSCDDDFHCFQAKSNKGE
ncbi:hypothetical protein PIL02S_03403 [Paenibacillus illinoisensis]|uniref:Uncharacterized protein n=1 Tax=Paenibacillus illinoisensis TaxID=59845 RepID=A0A2W0C891_9BACL|nr:hypothetical protein PIL02S_03403 [Paenibacillus illinoisensis]